MSRTRTRSQRAAIEVAFSGSVTPGLVARCTDGDAVIVVTDYAMATRLRQQPRVRWAWDGSMGVSVSEVMDPLGYAVTVGGLAASPVREALLEALVTLGAEVQP